LTFFARLVSLRYSPLMPLSPILLKNLTADQLHTSLSHIGMTPRTAR
jgi:hypothetical protein